MKILARHNYTSFAERRRHSSRVEEAAALLVARGAFTHDKAVHVDDIAAMIEGSSSQLDKLLRSRPGFVEINATGKKKSRRFFYLKSFLDYARQESNNRAYPSDVFPLFITSPDDEYSNGYPNDAAFIDIQSADKNLLEETPSVPVNTEVLTARLANFAGEDKQFLVKFGDIVGEANGQTVKQELNGIVADLLSDESKTRSRTEQGEVWQRLAVFAAAMTSRFRE